MAVNRDNGRSDRARIAVLQILINNIDATTTNLTYLVLGMNKEEGVHDAIEALIAMVKKKRSTKE